MPHARSLKNTKAASLLEVLISVTIFAMVSASILLVFDRSLFVYRGVADRNSAAQEAQIAIDWISRDIELAYSIAAAGPNSITLVNPQQRTIRYYLDAPTNTLQRQDCAGPNNLLAERVTQFSLKYYNITNAPIADPVNNTQSLKTIEIDTAVTNNNREFRLNTIARFEFNPKYAWAKAYGGLNSDTTAPIQPTQDGGYIVAGETYSFGAQDRDLLVIKTDGSGHPEWAKTYGGAGQDSKGSLQLTSDGGYVLGGQTGSFGAINFDYFLLRIDASGNVLLAKTYGGPGTEGPWSGLVQPASDGGYIIGGHTTSWGHPNYDFLLIKADSNGNVGAAYPGTWAKTYGDGSGVGWDSSYCLRPTGDGGYALLGRTTSFGASCDIFLLKTDSSGNLLWARAYGGSNTDFADSFQFTSDGGYILGGVSYSFTAGVCDTYLVKTCASGELQWAKAYGGLNEDGCYAINPTSDGGYIAGASSNSYTAGDYDAFLLKTNSTGELQWARTYGGAGGENIGSVQQTENGGFIVAGNTGSFGVGNDFFVLKTDATGGFGCCGLGQTVVPTVTDATAGTFANNITASVVVNDVTAQISVSSPTVTVTSPAIDTTTLCP